MDNGDAFTRGFSTRGFEEAYENDHEFQLTLMPQASYQKSSQC